MLLRALNAYVLPNNVEELILIGDTPLSGSGNALANKITGNLGSNILRGNAGDNILFGGQGVDTLIGGAGKDTMTGGGGLDRMVLTSLADSGAAFINRDVINTFARMVTRLISQRLTPTVSLAAFKPLRSCPRSRVSWGSCSGTSRMFRGLG